jgi:beta-N-acetylhexosaminidase
MAIQSTIFGLSGPKLTDNEAAFFKDTNPWAFILFARNIETPNQLRRLTRDLKDCVGRDALIFIDQEGGRVQRLRPPHWEHYRPASDFAALYAHNPALARRAVYLNMRLIADDLYSLGITADCAPVLDIPVAGADDIISDRAYGDTPQSVIPLAHAVMAGLMTGGVAPVIKHIPGHGRATVDSHKALPHIRADLTTLELTDFAPFNAFHDAPMAMTAHAVYDAIDREQPLTISKRGISKLIRGRFGFDGLLMSDDLDMKALSGTLTQRTELCLAAGCDIALQCSGQLGNMVKVAAGASKLSGRALQRAHKAANCTLAPLEFDRAAAQQELSAAFESQAVS